MSQVTIISYHFVRELELTKYPKIKGLPLSLFKEQIVYMEKYYQFVTMEDCINDINSVSNDFPSNAALLTFDDGYIDHFNGVFPLLSKKGIQGCFYPSSRSVLEHKILDVNKIHFLLASVSDINDLLENLFNTLDKYRQKFNLDSNDYYFKKLARKDRFDTKEIVFIKQLLQKELSKDVRDFITDELFKIQVSNDERSFAYELYMNTDQLNYMVENGMHVGSHGYDHYWLEGLSPENQEKEIDRSIKLLELINAPKEYWTMCYPHGSYNKSLIDILIKKQFKAALTIKQGMASLSKENIFKLERLDTNDLPKSSTAEPNSWTKMVIN